MDVDLSEHLRAREPPIGQEPTTSQGLERDSAAATERVQRQRAALRAGKRARQGNFAALPASKDEERRWQRSGRFTRQVRVTPHMFD